MKTTWSGVRQAVRRAAEAVAEAVRGDGAVGHVCDPSGFRCDCARRRAVNARVEGGGGPDGRRRDGRPWLESDREGLR